MRPPDRFAAALDRLAVANRLRDVRALSPLEGANVRTAPEGELILFSSNDYLGLSQHPAVRAAAAEAAATYGMGPRGSALICGYTDAHAALESALAALEGAEAALLFPTGYQANLALLQALGAPDVTILSDALNHASIIDGCRLARAAGAAVQVYRHRDLVHLEALLQQVPGQAIIVTDEVFSMEGTRAPLAAIGALRDAYGALLVTDAAHATLVLGPGGAGAAAAAGVRVDFQVGTLSKAFGAQGGFVTCSALRRRWLLNTARAFIFSTAISAPVVAAAHAALRVATADETLRDRLRAHEAHLAAALDRPVHGPIVPVVLGSEDRALTASAHLRSLGFHVPAIRPPTVPADACRLRVALSAAHTTDQVAALARALADLPGR